MIVHLKKEDEQILTLILKLLLKGKSSTKTDMPQFHRAIYPCHLRVSMAFSQTEQIPPNTRYKTLYYDIQIHSVWYLRILFPLRHNEASAHTALSSRLSLLSGKTPTTWYHHSQMQTLLAIQFGYSQYLLPVLQCTIRSDEIFQHFGRAACKLWRHDHVATTCVDCETPQFCQHPGHSTFYLHWHR